MDALTFETTGRTIATLLAVLGLLLLLSWALRRSPLARHMAGPAAGRLQVVASRPLDSRTRLVLARCDGREHLLAVGPAGVTLIESREAAASPPAGPGA